MNFSIVTPSFNGLAYLPRITVVVPSFNQGRFIEQTLRSVLDQNYPDLELMVMDGGSTDETLDVIRKYESRLACWVSEKDCGQTDAINKGFRRATGEILTWLNSDDLQEPGALQAVAEAFASGVADVVYGDYTLVTSDGRRFMEKKEIPFSFFLLLYGVNFIGQPSAFIRRSVLDRFGYLDESLQFMMDYEYWLRLAAGGARFKHIRRMLSLYRYHQTSKTVALESKQVEEMAAVRRRFTRDGPMLIRLKSIAARVARQVIKLCCRHTVDYLGGPLRRVAYRAAERKS